MPRIRARAVKVRDMSRLYRLADRLERAVQCVVAADASLLSRRH
jgi:hypothetical protein